MQFKQLDRDYRNLNSLNFTQAQVNFILGHSLASLYQQMLKQPIPENLKALVDKLERAQSKA